MAYACSIEEHTQLPACSLEDQGDVSLLHSTISMVVAYMANHHIPRDEWDGPYEYRNYLPDTISANDVAALSRIAWAAQARGIDLPPLLAPLYAGEDAPVAASDVEYLAGRARDVAELLGSLLAMMRAADAPAPPRFPWGWIALAVAGGLLLGAGLVAASRDGERR